MHKDKYFTGLPAKNIQDKDSQLLFVTLHEFWITKKKSTLLIKIIQNIHA